MGPVSLIASATRQAPLEVAVDRLTLRVDLGDRLFAQLAGQILASQPPGQVPFDQCLAVKGLYSRIKGLGSQAGLILTSHLSQVGELLRDRHAEHGSTGTPC